MLGGAADPTSSGPHQRNGTAASRLRPMHDARARRGVTAGAALPPARLPGGAPAASAELVEQPGAGDQKQGSEENSQERVQPDQREIERAESNPDPCGSQRTMRLQCPPRSRV